MPPASEPAGTGCEEVPAVLPIGSPAPVLPVDIAPAVRYF